MISGNVVDSAFVPIESTVSNDSIISNGNMSDPIPPLSPHSNGSPVSHPPSNNIDSSHSTSS